MPLSAAQVATIRRLTGYADRNREGFWSLADICASIEETTVTEIVALLARVAAVETAQSNQLGRAGLKRAEDVEFYQGYDAGGALNAEGDRLVRQIAALLNLPIRQSAFGPPSAGLAGRG